SGGYMAGFTGVKRTREPSPLVDADPGERIKDMDHEGVDVNLTLPSGWFGTWTAGDDVALEMAMYRAYHRWMADYCGAYLNRLGDLAAMIGSGVLDRYPTLRVGTLEAGHGWLPFWMARLDEHAETIKAALPELGRKPSEYVTGGRYFQSIEIPEGARLTNAVI